MTAFKVPPNTVPSNFCKLVHSTIYIYHIRIELSRFVMITTLQVPKVHLSPSCLGEKHLFSCTIELASYSLLYHFEFHYTHDPPLPTI